MGGNSSKKIPHISGQALTVGVQNHAQTMSKSPRSQLRVDWEPEKMVQTDHGYSNVLAYITLYEGNPENSSNHVYEDPRGISRFTAQGQLYPTCALSLCRNQIWLVVISTSVSEMRSALCFLSSSPQHLHIRLSASVQVRPSPQTSSGLSPVVDLCCSVEV